MLIKKKAEKIGNQMKFIGVELLPGKIKKPLRQCCLCKNEFEIDTDKKYVVKMQESLMNITYYDAIDCPYCGSQNLVWKRLRKVNQDDKNTNL